MMQRQFVIGLAMNSILTPIGANAQNIGVGSDVIIDQIGTMQSAMILQTGVVHAAVTQAGQRQSARIAQTAGPTDAAALTLEMRGKENEAAATQSNRAVARLVTVGVANRAIVMQRGAIGVVGNMAALMQAGTRNEASLSQTGSANLIDLVQTGDGNAAAIVQAGDHLSIRMAQDGGARAVVVQSNR